MLFFDLSYVALWLVTSMVAIILRKALKETVWLLRVHRDVSEASRPDVVPAGTRLPQFALPMLKGGQQLTRRNLIGESSTLLFIAAADSSSALYERMAESIHGLWHKAESRLYVVCSGPEEECRHLAESLDFAAGHAMGTPVALDADGGLARSLRINRTPAAIRINKEGRVRQHGFQRTQAEVLQWATELSFDGVSSSIRPSSSSKA